MALENRFRQSVIATLAKRASNFCSNPDCGALTSGPADDPTKAVNIGEAAHIYGANPGSARYDAAMASVDRGDITNAIWLCGNCHKMIDDDPLRFPAGLLFEWQRNHMQRLGEMIGKPGADIRRRYEDRHLEEFGRVSYLAERIILEKPEYWEYRLTTEMLRYEMAPVLRRWEALNRGLYMKPTSFIDKMSAIPWIQDRLAEIKRITAAFHELMNMEFDRAWGPAGEPGNDIAIVHVCRLFAELCNSALAWEEAVRFVRIDEIFRECQTLYVGIAGNMIDEAAKVPEFLAGNFKDTPEPGEYRLTLVLTLPEGWADKAVAAMERASQRLMSDSYD